MTIEELHFKLQELKIPADKYYLHGLYGSTDDNDKIALTIKKGEYTIEYEIYFKERGERHSIKKFTNEAEVTIWILKKLVDELELWNTHIDKQKEICKKNNSSWKPINKNLKVGISLNLNKDPINGLRQPAENGTTGWFIWSGEYLENDDFFQPICAEHLLLQRPEIIKYLGLDIGFRFLADKKGYEDIWYDENLKNI